MKGAADALGGDVAYFSEREESRCLKMYGCADIYVSGT